jgi:uncharacterized membrane protein
MNKGKVLLIVGVVLALIGLALAVYAIMPAEQTSTETILSGAGNYIYWSVGGLMNGNVSFSFSVDTGTVNVWVFDKANYNIYANGGTPVPLQYVPNLTALPAGLVYLKLPDSGQYYLVFDHGAASQGIAQTVTATMKVTGTSIMVLTVGIVLLVIGAIIAIVGVMMRRKEPAAQKKQGPTDVVMVGQQTPPPPPTK